ncbi:polar amino acid transport system permease protein [Anaerovibrio lipolyticus DSM 3074]|uniref:Polar amino acid transport system permease protein n=1 Tax=Anaerovibrio lipolyticus DSM 3074 TaxID=1120997 RepID=A0A1M6DAF8_9FIRM|nr:amino acid ABC transporter permease [Anaerovibrio lipolyticus]SHI70155.1 polar amino acid transport system permease protein [Anaerovibrio lipolyticus DSM 3074]
MDTIYQIFIANGAFATICKGLLVTVEISLAALVLGTLLGAVLCFFRMGKNRPMRFLTAGYIALVRGCPVLMLLMLLFYGVLAQSGLAPIVVAILAFALHTAAHVAELFRSSIMATDFGQVEAARTLGFSRIQAFRLVTLPQMMHIARPVYQSTIVNLIQWTSVVGYVTITDLTRVIYNTASRTMQPMITILGGMIIYIAISYCVYGIFAWLEWRDKREVAE